MNPSPQAKIAVADEHRQFGLRELFAGVGVASLTCLWIGTIASASIGLAGTAFLGYPAVHLAAVSFLSRFAAWRVGLIGALIFNCVALVFAMSTDPMLLDLDYLLISELAYAVLFCGIAGGAFAVSLANCRQRLDRILGHLPLWLILLWFIAALCMPVVVAV